MLHWLWWWFHLLFSSEDLDSWNEDLLAKKKEYKDTNGNEKLTIVELTILYLIYSLDFHFYLVFCSKTIDLWMQKIFTMIFFCVKNDSENIYFVGCAMVQFDASLSMD